MATPNLGLTLLDVGQREKEATINANMTLIDTAVGTGGGGSTTNPVFHGTSLTLDEGQRIKFPCVSFTTGQWFQTTSTSNPFTMTGAMPGAATGSGAQFSAINKTDPANSDFLSIACGNWGTGGFEPYLFWGKLVSGNYANHTSSLVIKTANASTEIIAATINYQTVPSAASDLTRKDYVDNKTYRGEFSADPSTSGLHAGATYYNTISSKLKVLLSTGTWVNT